jgi:hypothetical protein
MKIPFSEFRRAGVKRALTHMLFARAIYTAVIALLIGEYVKTPAVNSPRSYAFTLMGLFLLLLGWMAYLRLNGTKAPVIDKRLFEWYKPSKRKMGDMADYIDEPLEQADDLENDERDMCRLIANIVVGMLLIGASLL